MAAGVPAVSYDCPSGPREIVEHDVNGLLVLPGSEEGLAAALLRVATDADLREPARASGAVATARAWDADALAEQWEQVFAEALAARPRGVRRLAARQATHAVPADRPAEPWHDESAPTSSAGPRPPTRGARLLALATSTADDVTDEWFVVPGVAGSSGRGGAPGVGPRRRSSAGSRRPSTPAYLSLRDPGDHGWPERRGPVADLAEALVRGMTPRVVLEPWPSLEHRPDAAEPGVRRRGAVLGRGRGWRPARAARQPLRRPDAARRRHGHAAGRGPGRADAAVDDAAHPGGDDGAGGRRLHVGRRRRPRLVRPAAATPRDLGRQVRDRDVARVERPRPFREPRRAALLAAQPAPLRSVGPHHPRRHRRAGAAVARRRPTRRSRWSTTATSCRPRRCRRSTRTPSRAPCTGSPAWPSTSSTSTTTCCSADRSGPRRFFDAAGRFAVFTAPHLVGLGDPNGQPAYITAALRNRWLLEEAFGVALTHHLVHAPYPQRVSVLAEVADRFADRGRGHRARAVPLRDRRVDGVVAGAALRADDRLGVRGEHREQLRRPGDHQRRPGARERARNAGRTPSAWATTTTTRWRWPAWTVWWRPSSSATCRSPRRGSGRDYRRRSRPTSRWKAGCQVGRASPPSTGERPASATAPAWS